uniref:DNA helicase n=1 Tax=Tanacetum cinerariifolium TaxID=118510 RepID=A0A6L2LKP7_TANCI|nr:DNA helicase [Tanacetum cinerariifolium]
MRLYQSDLTEAQKQRLHQFSTWLLDIGDGNIGTLDESETKDIFNVHIHVHLCISDSDMALTDLINFIYDDMTLQTPTVEDLQKKAIVAPTNKSAYMINAHVLSLVNHQQHIYLSSDETIPHGNDGGETELLYPTEYLNSLNRAIIPHMLQLKVGAPIIHLCNLNIAAGMCNRTRLIVTQLLDKVIEARIITGTRTEMAEPSNPAPNQVDKGKLPLVEATTVSIADIKPTHVDQAIEGNAIQANMDLKDTDYFNQPMQLNNASRISCFMCTHTKTWDRTLPNDITLIFGRYTSFIPIPNDNFPEHFFNFIAYNEVDAHADINATSATYYYLNPKIPEASHIRNVYADFINPVPALEIERQPYSTQLEEQMRNRHTIQSLLNVNPQHYEQIRFTTEATLLQIIAPNGCYCFKPIVDDGTATTTITCFNPDAYTFVRDCNSVVNSVEDKDTYHVPSIMSQAEGHRYIFQYHFGKKAKPGRPNFTLNDVLNLTTQPLLALPATESASSPPAKILAESSTSTNPPSTTEVPLPTTTTKDNVTEAAKNPKKKAIQRALFFQEGQPQDKKPRHDA